MRGELAGEVTYRCVPDAIVGWKALSLNNGFVKETTKAAQVLRNKRW